MELAFADHFGEVNEMRLGAEIATLLGETLAEEQTESNNLENKKEE